LTEYDYVLKPGLKLTIYCHLQNNFWLVDPQVSLFTKGGRSGEMPAEADEIRQR
jgi:hypothetical protein